jgi:hypothetical protein
VELHAIQPDLGPGGFVINGVSTNDKSGKSVSSAGDVNGDGFADLIVGVYRDGPNGNLSGASFVVFGNADGTAVELSAIEPDLGAGGFVINGVSNYDYSGVSVSSAGDVDGDGLADLIVGADRDDPNGNINSGASFVVFGKADGAAVELSTIESGTGGFVINGVSTNDKSGKSVSSAGDVNGDGLADLIVGAHKDDPIGQDRGASFVVFGKTDGTAVQLSAIEPDLGTGLGTGGFVINGVGAGEKSGYSVSSAGDVNGDGLADLIVGAPYGNGGRGASFVVFGKADGAAVELSTIESGTGGFVINGSYSSYYSAISVSGAGDVNGDGFADLIVGEPYGNANYSGASFVVFGGQGSNATIGTTGADTLTGDATANQLVAGQGDDTLIGNGGADVLRGGAGDDVLAISDTTFASLDGGLGTDTLRLDANITLNLTAIANSRLSGLEVIDLNSTGSTVTLNTDDILSIVGDEAANDLRVNGTAGDTLNLNSNGFGATGSTEEINDVTYDIYSNAALDTSVRLLVQQGIDVTGAPDTSIVVFDLVNGVSSDHSSRNFDGDVTYTIYVVVDATSERVVDYGIGAAYDSLGPWEGAGELGGDDTVWLVSDNGDDVEGYSIGEVTATLVSNRVRWKTSDGSSAAALWGSGWFERVNSLDNSWVDLWLGSVGRTDGMGMGFLSIGAAYGPTIPVGVLTSQGLI